MDLGQPSVLRKRTIINTWNIWEVFPDIRFASTDREYVSSYTLFFDDHENVK